MNQDSALVITINSDLGVIEAIDVFKSYAVTRRRMLPDNLSCTPPPQVSEGVAL